MMIGKKSIFLVVAVAATAAVMGGCGNPLEGGSDPSGSVLRVVGESQSAATQDLYFCEGQAAEYASMTVTIENQSRPNFEDSITTADGTNSHVTMNLLEFDYTPLNLSGTIPGIQMAFTTGIEPDGELELTLPVISEPTLEHIRANFPTVGRGDAMNLRVDITYWGKDAFQVDVNVRFSTTLTVDDFNPCIDTTTPVPVDIPPPDQSSP